MPYAGQEVQWEEIARIQALAFPHKQAFEFVRCIQKQEFKMRTFLKSKHLLLTLSERLKQKFKIKSLLQLRKHHLLQANGGPMSGRENCNYVLTPYCTATESRLLRQISNNVFKN